jgi:hypothetical protein
MQQAPHPLTRRNFLMQVLRASAGIGTAGALLLVRQTGVINAITQLASPKSTKKSYPMFQLRDIAKQAGVQATHHKVQLDKKLDNIMPWMASVGAAAAAADYNNDGLTDVFVSSSGRNTPCHLYKNNGDGTFTDVAEAAGVANLNAEGGVMDAVWGDFDNDGWTDLYIVKWSAPNQLFRNNRDGTFTNITESSGTGDVSNGNAAIWFDYNGDGLLDIVIMAMVPSQMLPTSWGLMILAGRSMLGPVTSSIPATWISTLQTILGKILFSRTTAMEHSPMSPRVRYRLIPEKG